MPVLFRLSGAPIVIAGLLAAVAITRAQAPAHASEESLKDAVARAKSNSPDSAEYADALADLGDWYRSRSRFADAEPLLRDALVIKSKTSGDSISEEVKLGDFYRDLQNHEGTEPTWGSLANDHYFKALARIPAQPGSETTLWASVVVRIGSLRSPESPPHPDGENEFMQELVSRALVVQERGYGAGRDGTALALAEVARLPVDSPERERAFARCRELASPQSLQPSDPAVWAPLMEACAEASLDSRRFEEAETFARRALELRSPDSIAALLAVHAWLTVAAAEIKLKRFTDALTSLETAKSLCSDQLGPQHRVLVRLLRLEADAMSALGRGADADKARKEANTRDDAWKKKATNPRLHFPNVRKKRDPAYTESARAARIEGTVLLLVEIRTDGTPRLLLVYQRLPDGLTESAWDTVSKWRFDPMRLDGMPVDTTAVIEVNFKFR